MTRPYEKLLPDTPNVIKCRDFLLKNVRLLGGCRGTGLMIGTKAESSCVEYACHATLNPNYIGTMKQACGGVNPTKEEFPLTMKFLEYLIHESPWQDLFKEGFEIVWGSDDLPKGIILSEECCKKYPGALLKNLFILLRCIQEFHDQFKAWACLIEHGMNPDDAFYICRFVTLVDDDNYAGTALSMNGWHWPLTDNQYRETFDWEAYYKHKPNVQTDAKSQTYNKFFMKAGVSYPKFEVSGVTLMKKGRFSSVSVLNSQALIEGFDAWKTKNKILKYKDVKGNNHAQEENLDY